MAHPHPGERRIGTRHRMGPPGGSAAFAADLGSNAVGGEEQG